MGDQLSKPSMSGPVQWKADSSKGYKILDLHSDMASLTLKDWENDITPCKKLVNKYSLNSLEMTQNFQYNKMQCNYKPGLSS